MASNLTWLAPAPGRVGDILPTFVTPTDARNYINETDANYKALNSDVVPSIVDQGFKDSWATQFASWGIFKQQNEDVGWLNTKAVMDQTDRWAANLLLWRKGFTDRGGKPSSPAPIAPGQGVETQPTELAPWIKTLGILAIVGGFVYLGVKIVGVIPKHREESAEPIMPNPGRYRINYAYSGQVSHTFPSFRAARQELERSSGEQYSSKYQIEVYESEEGDWFSTGAKGRL